MYHIPLIRSDIIYIIKRHTYPLHKKNTRSGEHIVNTLSQHNSRHLDDDLSNVLLALEVCVSLLGLLEWEHLVNEGLDLVSGDELVHVLESKLHKKCEHCC